MQTQNESESNSIHKKRMSRRLRIILIVLIAPNVLLTLLGTSIIDVIRFGAIIVFPYDWFPSYYAARYFGETQSYGYAKLSFLWGGKVYLTFRNTAFPKLKENDDFTLFMVNHGDVFFGFSKNRKMTPKLEEKLIHAYTNVLDDKQRQSAREAIGADGNGSEFFRKEIEKFKNEDISELVKEKESFERKHMRHEQRILYGIKNRYIDTESDYDTLSAGRFVQNMKDASPEERILFVRYLFSATSTGDNRVSDAYFYIYNERFTERERYEARCSLREVIDEIDPLYQENKFLNRGWRNESYEFFISELERLKEADERRAEYDAEQVDMADLYLAEMSAKDKRRRTREAYGATQGFYKSYKFRLAEEEGSVASYFLKNFQNSSPLERLPVLRFAFSGIGIFMYSWKFKEIYKNVLDEDERYEARQSMRDIVDEVNERYELTDDEIIMERYRNFDYKYLVSELEKYKDIDALRAKAEAE